MREMAAEVKKNYQRAMEEEIERIEREQTQGGSVPTLLLHSCCGPCSTSVLEQLAEHFLVTVLYYNPNIFPEEEYRHRVQEQKRFTESFPTRYPISFLEGPYEPEKFYELAKGLELVPEGGERCRKCFTQRLTVTAHMAAERGFDYYTTTLTVSPLKNAKVLNELGEAIGELAHITWLPSDFKKKNGYLRSVELSREYEMYRQDYCGCVYSKQERERKQKNQEKTPLQKM